MKKVEKNGVQDIVNGSRCVVGATWRGDCKRVGVEEGRVGGGLWEGGVELLNLPEINFCLLIH